MILKDPRAASRWRYSLGPDRQFCMVCGVNQHERAFGLQVHHIVKKQMGGGRRFDAAPNFLLMCWPCHMRCEGLCAVGNDIPLAVQLHYKAQHDPEHYDRKVLKKVYPNLPRRRKP